MTDMLQGGLLGIVKVGKKRSRRNKTDGEIVNAETDERIHMEMLHQALPCIVIVKIMGFQSG